VRIAGIVLLTIAALIVVPALTYAGYLHLISDPWFADPAGIKTRLALVVAALGACVGGIGVAAAIVAGGEGPPSR
jgi:hypothetical protein